MHDSVYVVQKSIAAGCDECRMCELDLSVDDVLAEICTLGVFTAQHAAKQCADDAKSADLRRIFMTDDLADLTDDDIEAFNAVFAYDVKKFDIR